MWKGRSKQSPSAREHDEKSRATQAGRDRHGDVENVRALAGEVLSTDQGERVPEAITQRTDGTTFLRPRATRAVPAGSTNEPGSQRQSRNVLRVPPRSSSAASKTETVSDFKIAQEAGSSRSNARGASPWSHSAWRDQLDEQGHTRGPDEGVPGWASRRRVGGVVEGCVWDDAATEVSEVNHTGMPPGERKGGKQEDGRNYSEVEWQRSLSGTI